MSVELQNQLENLQNDLKNLSSMYQVKESLVVSYTDRLNRTTNELVHTEAKLAVSRDELASVRNRSEQSIQALTDHLKTLQTKLVELDKQANINKKQVAQRVERQQKADAVSQMAYDIMFSLMNFQNHRKKVISYLNDTATLESVINNALTSISLPVLQTTIVSIIDSAKNFDSSGRNDRDERYTVLHRHLCLIAKAEIESQEEIDKAKLLQKQSESE